MNLQEKIFQHFEGKVVRKDLTKSIKGNAVVPSYVLEYLLGQHCASFDKEIIEQGLVKVKNIIKEHFVHRDEAEYIKSIIKEHGEHSIIDKVTATLNEKKDVYEASFSNLGISRVEISSEIIKKHKRLLSGGGVWCIITIGYLSSEESDSSPWIIENLKPIQISKVDLNEYIDTRKEFSRDEWIDFLIQSVGLEPEHFSFRSKLIQLCRLIPFCENNYNFIELGPKGTGKSHIFSELSPHGILISGGDVSQAKLFVNNSNNRIGLVGYWDVVTFDEFAGSQKKPDKKLVDIMKNYMANKTFSRGRDIIGATASMVFVGNTEHSVSYMLTNSNLFDALPGIYYDSAFLDRLHTYIPGWEVSKLRNEMFTNGYGFIVDYLAEVLKEFRKDDYSLILKDYIELDNSLTARDREGIFKTFSGLMKIIYPDKNFNAEEIIELIEFSIEGRKRVKDQLIKIDETFEHVRFVYKDKITGRSKVIETLENIKYNFNVKEDDEEIGEDQGNASNPEDQRPKKLKTGQILIHENQEGISFKKLFADYLFGAKKITLTDPYIRYPHQMKLLMEFCVMLVELKKVEVEIIFNVFTWNEPDEKLQESINNLEEIAHSVFDLGIKLNYEMNPNIHDRSIVTDNGWKIILGRGLDIFAKHDARFSIADIYQEKRLCRACEITFIKIDETYSAISR